MHKSNNGSNQEQDDIDYRQNPTGLEHGTRLIGAPIIVRPRDGDAAEAGGPIGVAVGLCAVKVADVAEVPDADDEGGEEAQVDEADEHGVGRRAVVGEEGEDDPGDGEDRDDEEDEDGFRGEEVFGVVAVDEPGEHAHDWDLGVLVWHFTIRCVRGSYQSQDLKDP